MNRTRSNTDLNDQKRKSNRTSINNDLASVNQMAGVDITRIPHAVQFVNDQGLELAHGEMHAQTNRTSKVKSSTNSRMRQQSSRTKLNSVVATEVRSS